PAAGEPSTGEPAAGEPSAGEPSAGWSPSWLGELTGPGPLVVSVIGLPLASVQVGQQRCEALVEVPCDGYRDRDGNQIRRPFRPADKEIRSADRHERQRHGPGQTLYERSGVVGQGH